MLHDSLVDESYIFNVSKTCKLIFRVVAGEATENSAKTGQILANFEPVSDDFVLVGFKEVEWIENIK